jgi:hypothetical protein
MKRSVVIFIPTSAVALCLIGYLCGRAHQHSEYTPAERPSSPRPAATPNPPADFGAVVYRDIANISFVDLYETIQNAPRQSRVEWLREINQLPESPRKIGALNGFFRALVQADSQTAADLVINLPRHRGPAMDAMIAAAPPSAMPVLAEMLLKVPEAARNYQLTDHLGMVLDEWAQVDPEAVVRFFDQHKDLPLQEYGASFVQTWAGLDADAARKWLDTHREDISGLDYESWLTGWFGADQDAAVNYALQNMSEEKLHHAIPGLAPKLFEQSEPRAKGYLDKLPAGEIRQDALSGIARLATDFSSNYSPSTMTKFITQFPASDWPKELSSVMERWLQLGANEFLSWTSALPPETQKHVVENFPAPMWDKPEPDFLPVLQMPQSQLRTNILRRLAAGFSEGRYSARETLSKLNLPDEYKAEIAALLPEGNDH